MRAWPIWAAVAGMAAAGYVGAQIAYPPGTTPTDVNSQIGAQVQSTTVITDANGGFAGSWPVAFASSPSGRLAEIEIATGATTPFKCSFYSGGVTATTFSGKCWQIVATTLPTTTTALAGLVVSPVQNAAANLTVRVVGRQ